MSHPAMWMLADASERFKLYVCRYRGCDRQHNVDRKLSEWAPPERHEDEEDGMTWSLPHMEATPGVPDRAELVAEVARVEAELGNAIYMHRNAWVKARQRRDELAAEVRLRHPKDERKQSAELGALCETDSQYGRRIADVKFWQAERLTLATNVSALFAMIDHRRRVTLREAPPNKDWLNADASVPRPRD